MPPARFSPRNPLKRLPGAPKCLKALARHGQEVHLAASLFKPSSAHLLQDQLLLQGLLRSSHPKASSPRLNLLLLLLANAFFDPFCMAFSRSRGSWAPGPCVARGVWTRAASAPPRSSGPRALGHGETKMHLRGKLSLASTLDPARSLRDLKHLQTIWNHHNIIFFVNTLYILYFMRLTYMLQCIYICQMSSTCLETRRNRSKAPRPYPRHLQHLKL